MLSCLPIGAIADDFLFEKQKKKTRKTFTNLSDTNILTNGNLLYLYSK